MTDLPQMQSVINALGWMLIHFVWQGGCIAVGFWAVCSLSNRKNAILRYWAGLLALFACLLVSAGTFLLYLKPGGGQVAAAAVAMPAIAAVSGYKVSAGQFLQQALEPTLPLLVILWGCGVSFLSTRIVFGWIGTRRLVRIGARPVSRHLREVVRQLRAQLQITKAVRIFRSSRVLVPTVVGWLRPVILLPASVIARLPVEQLEMIIAHELGHVRRNDYLVNLLQVIIETLFFYHPAVAWMSKEIRQEREHCCDDLVVAHCGRPVLYARALANLEVLRTPERLPATAMAATGGDLFHRVSRIVRVELPRTSSGFAQVMMMFGLALATAVGARQGLEMSSKLQAGDMTAVSYQAPDVFRDQVLVAPGLGQGIRLHQDNVQQQRLQTEARVRRAATVDQAGSEPETKKHPAGIPDDIAMPAAAPLSAEHARTESISAELLQAQPPAVTPPVIEFAMSEPLELASLPTRMPDRTKVEKEDVSAVLIPESVITPDYPYRAFREGVAGFVKLEFTVDQNGKVRDIAVVEAQPGRTFDSAAIKALKKWRFEVSQSHDEAQRLYQVFDFAVADNADRPQQRQRRCDRTGSNICGSHYSPDTIIQYGSQSERVARVTEK